MKNILGTFLSICLSLILLSNAGGIALQQQQVNAQNLEESQTSEEDKNYFDIWTKNNRKYR